MSYNGLSYLLFSYIFSEIDDDGNVLSVMLSDDLANTFLMFGKEEYGTTEPIILQENRLVPLTSKKKPFLRDTPRNTSSEESEEEEEDAPVMHETAISAVDDEMPGGVDTRQAIGFHGQACNSKTPQLVLE
ncbi:hypothetical protein EB796_017276 [Bugula neritina]|uniref:Uncharacterized protein n=1 Tax=Bugula neritina TaxID=10212 RepID=A0A7J7JDP8_BUGNE|nr:hypothetical protein EB796_017276 [Bugula neritina]